MMHKKVAIVTGATSGIGLKTAETLTREAYTVVIACRDKQKGACLAADILEQKGKTGSSVDVMLLDLASLHSVRAFAETFMAKYDRLHLLVNNAGGFYDSLQRTEDGFEMTMGVNYLAPFLLTRLLLPILKNTQGARIVNITSKAAFYAKLKLDEDVFTSHRYGFKAYAASKLAQILFTIDLAEELKGTGVTVNAAYPGRVATNIWKGSSLLMKLVAPIMMRNSISAVEGAKPGIHLAVSPELEGITGKLFDQEGVMEYNKACLDVQRRKELMELSFAALKRFMPLLNLNT